MQVTTLEFLQMNKFFKLTWIVNEHYKMNSIPVSRVWKSCRIMRVSFPDDFLP